MLTHAGLERRDSVDGKELHSSHVQHQCDEGGSDSESTASFDPEEVGAHTDSDVEYDATESESDEVEDQHWNHVSADSEQTLIGLSVSEKAMEHLKTMAEKEMQKMRQTIQQLRKENLTLKATLCDQCVRHEVQRSAWAKAAVALGRQVADLSDAVSSLEDGSASLHDEEVRPESKGVLSKDTSSLSAEVCLARIRSAVDKRDAGAVVRAMSARSEDETVQVEGCSALVLLTPCSEAAEFRAVAEQAGPAWLALQREYRQLSRSGSVEGVIAAAAAHRSCAEVQEAMCRIVLCMSRPALELEEMTKQCDRVGAVCEAMAAHMEDEAVQEMACGALRNLAVDAAHQAHMLQVERGGPVSLVLSAMAANAHSARVQEHGCGFLRNLAEGGSEGLAACGGVRAILSAMEAHAWDARVQEEGCGALRHLAFNRHGRERIVREGAVGRVVGAMEQHPWTEGVQVEAVGAVRILALEHGAALAEHGGVPALLLAMAEHVTSPHVQEEGCGAIRNLAAGDEAVRGLLAESEGAEAVLVAMKGHAWHAAVQEEGCAALRNLAMHDNCRRRLARKGAALVVRAAVKGHPAHTSVQRHGKALLESLSHRAQEEAGPALEGRSRARQSCSGHSNVKAAAVSHTHRVLG